MNTAVLNPQETQVSAMSALDIMMNETVMVRIESMAARMATSKITTPKHLQGNEGDCMAIIMQAMQWGMNPYAVAQKTHLVNGTLGYEAQLVNAVITARAPVKERLHFEWYGDWSKVNGKDDKSPNLGIKVSATLRGENQPRVIDISMAQVGPVRNSPLWAADPRQQIAYLATKRWARLYCPDVILGVYTPDEVIEREELDVTPVQSTVKKHQGASGLKAQMAQREQSQETVIDMAPNNFDVKGLINQINALNTIEELKALAKTIPADLGEPAKTDISTAYANRKNYVQLVVDLDSADTIESINSIMAERFEPNTSLMSDEQIDEVSALFERKSAELTP
ncbi:RecT family recombinase [Acinetobacter bereziniae]|uniref:RecT family recombinase n=1 Tax=Acinetobacter bereziniae TaxID=106648 RepID=UPI002480FE28|nr:RecT family recombinase [Acinetobacter bereziniae]WMW72979.1 RecT family recombinase [Acinetobacter bereziniae]